MQTTGGGDLVLAERRAVRTGRPLTLGAAIGDMSCGDNDRRLACFRLRGGNRGYDPVVVVAVNLKYLPAAGGETPLNILGPGQIGFTLDGDAVAVVDIDQVAQFEVTGKRRRLVADPFLQAAVADEGVDMMVYRLEVGRIEAFGRHFGGDAHADAVGESLTQRAGRNFDADSVAELWMPRSPAPPLAEIFDLFHGQIETEQMQQRIKEHRAMTGGKNETVAVRPARIVRIEFEEVSPQCHSTVGCSHREAGVT